MVLTAALLLLSVHIVQAADVDAAKPMPVYPATLKGAAPVELHHFLTALLRERHEDLGWSHEPAADHSWQNRGEVTLAKFGDRNMQVRQAALRIRVMGQLSTVLRKAGRVELGWTLTYMGNLNELKPGMIRIQPGLDVEPCFGRQYSGCTFEFPLGALKSSGADISEVCSARDGSDLTVAYSISYDGRRPVVVVWSESAGSGGASASVEILLRSNAKIEACGVEADQSSTPSTVHAPMTEPPSRSIDLDQLQTDRATTFRTVVTRTKLCMFEAAQSMLRLGARHPEQVVAFQVSTCGGLLQQHMLKVEGRPSGETSAFITALAYEQLQRAARH